GSVAQTRRTNANGRTNLIFEVRNLVRHLWGSPNARSLRRSGSRVLGTTEKEITRPVPLVLLRVLLDALLVGFSVSDNGSNRANLEVTFQRPWQEVANALLFRVADMVPKLRQHITWYGEAWIASILNWSASIQPQDQSTHVATLSILTGIFEHYTSKTHSHAKNGLRNYLSAISSPITSGNVEQKSVAAQTDNFSPLHRLLSMM
ncbi:MAG: hypothetical protein MHM6MM_005669, partial [Cercozoa sp. M6MM]